MFTLQGCGIDPSGWPLWNLSSQHILLSVRSGWVLAFDPYTSQSPYVTQRLLSTNWQRWAYNTICSPTLSPLTQALPPPPSTPLVEGRGKWKKRLRQMERSHPLSPFRRAVSLDLLKKPDPKAPSKPEWHHGASSTVLPRALSVAGQIKSNPCLSGLCDGFKRQL